MAAHKKFQWNWAIAAHFYEKKMKGKMRDFGNAYVSVNQTLISISDAPRCWVTWITAHLAGNQRGRSFGSTRRLFRSTERDRILVREVRSGTAAEKAGLKAGDVIVKVNGNPVGSLSELRQQLRDKSDEKTVSLGILRKGSEMNVPVTIEKPKPMDQRIWFAARNFNGKLKIHL